jgi:hypothetical protein
MLRLVDLLKLSQINDQEINNLVIMSHTEAQEKKLSVGKVITAYDLWRSDYDNRKKNEFNRDLNTPWEFFNRTHGEGALKNYKYLLSFVQIPINKKLVFTGFYKIIGRRPVSEKILHPVQQTPMIKHEENILEYDDRLKDYEGKLILDGWKFTPNIKRNLQKNKDVFLVKAILLEIPEHKFNHQIFKWSTNRISKLPISWQNRLSELFGIYLLVDCKGNQYVGSAFSKDGGFLRRWKQYENTGHGGNIQLRKLKKEQQIYTVSILETAPSSYNKNQVIEMENQWKEKLGTRAHGLNSN